MKGKRLDCGRLEGDGKGLIEAVAKEMERA